MIPYLYHANLVNILVNNVKTQNKIVQFVLIHYKEIQYLIVIVYQVINLKINFYKNLFKYINF